jgi:hypothetical protein
VDAAELARRIELPGGNIRNIAVSAAFLAAEMRQTISRAHVLQAAESEYRKVGKMLAGVNGRALVSR